MDRQNLQGNLASFLNRENNSKDYSVSDIHEINAGWETELFTFKATHSVNGEIVAADLVLRVFSGDSQDKPLREYHLMRRLVEVGYPVPPVYYIDTSGMAIGKKFIIMQRIMGKSLDDTYRSDDPEVRLRGVVKLVSLFLQLHRLDTKQFNGLPKLQTVTTPEYINYYSKVSDELAPWLSPVFTWLEENKPMENESLVLTHNDFHGFNVMLEDGVPYVIDWSSARVSDSRVDLGWTLMLFDTFGGEEYAEMILDQYAEQGGFVADYMYFVVLAVVRRIIDLLSVLVGSGSSGMRPDIVEMMHRERAHFTKVHGVLTRITGVRLEEFDKILAGF